MSKYLFIFTIGPVQSFIAQSRKTQDLYAGSQLLSTLVKFAFEVAKKESNSFELIFPFEQAVSMPNRFVALLSPKTSINLFGDNLRNVVAQKLLDIADKEMGALFFKEAKAQVADFLESYWAAIPFENEKRNELGYYQKQYRKLERLLGAVKNYRNYNQFDEEPARKCSVNGHYNALFYRQTDAEVKGKRDPQKTKHLSNTAIVNASVDISKLDKGEGICGLTMLRRCFNSKPSFPSVSRIALLNIIEKLKDTQEMERFLFPFGGMEKFNEQLFYDESLTEEAANEEYLVPTNFKTTIDAYKALKVRAKEEGLEFLKYYAILIFDADDMGVHFSKCPDLETHNNLSKRLSDYANWARTFVDEGRGKTIYAGGDDFLGMLNLMTLFETMEELRFNFGSEFSDEELTFSAGVAIAHYKTPLGEVLNYARKMEKKAKDYKGKNAFGIVAMKHSGEVLETVMPWTKKDDPNTWNTSTLKRIHEKLQIGVSAAFIQNLYEELTIWDDNPEEYRSQAEHEIRRFIFRAKGSVPKTKVDELVVDVQSLYEQVLTLNTQNFLSALNVVDFLNRKVS